MSSKSVSSVEEFLKENGPGLSSHISKSLIDSGLSPQTARQRISRAARGNVKRLQGLSFPRNEKFFYLEGSFGTPPFWNALWRDFEQVNSNYRHIIQGLEKRSGIIPAKHSYIISGCPIKQKGHLNTDNVVSALERIDLVERTQVKGIGDCIALRANGYFGSPSIGEMRARLNTEDILLSALKDWFRKLGIISYDKVSVRTLEHSPEVSTCAWDVCGPSYLRPFTERVNDNKTLPGFVVCDVLLSQASVTLPDIEYFFRKCSLLDQLKKLRPIFPIFVADHFNDETFKKGKSEGILLATPAALFGEDIAEGLRSLLKTLTKAAETAAKSPEIIFQLFDKLGKIEGAAANLRGSLFELIVGHCVREREGNFIEIGWLVKDPQTGKSAEIDVLRIKENQQTWVYECKAHQPTERVTKDMVESWFNDRVPFIYKTLRKDKRHQKNDFGFEYWTCGTFNSEAEAYLKSLNTKKYTVGWKDGTDVKDYARKINNKSIMDTLNEHYFKHPVSQLESEAPTKSY